jgi:tRNA-dihydrouridine synthase B
MVEDATAAAQSYTGSADWEIVARIADSLSIPVFGSGDCVEPAQIVDRMRSGVDGVLVGRGVLRNPWILAQAQDMAGGRAAREVTLDDRGRFLLDYIDLLLHERVDEARALTHDRWVVNKLRALASYFTKGLEGGARLRTAINTAESLNALTEAIARFFFAPCAAASSTPPAPDRLLLHTK